MTLNVGRPRLGHEHVRTKYNKWGYLPLLLNFETRDRTSSSVVYFFVGFFVLFSVYCPARDCFIIIVGEGLQNLEHCSVPTTFSQRGIFIVPPLLFHGASVFVVSSEATPEFICLL